MSEAPFVWPIRVYHEDTDGTGVVYHANYLRWLERGRTEWLRARGVSQQALATDHGVVFTLADLNIVYLKPARLDDALEIHTTISERKRVSFSFEQRVVRVADSLLLARAAVRAACVDARHFKPCALPDF